MAAFQQKKKHILVYSLLVLIVNFQFIFTICFISETYVAEVWPRAAEISLVFLPPTRCILENSLIASAR